MFRPTEDPEPCMCDRISRINDELKRKEEWWRRNGDKQQCLRVARLHLNELCVFYPASVGDVYAVVVVICVLSVSPLPVNHIATCFSFLEENPRF